MLTDRQTDRQTPDKA